MHKTIITLSTLALGAVIGTSAVSADTTYNVKSGDTLTKIAQANSTTVARLAGDNNISNIHNISVGQQLKIANDDSSATQTSSSDVYTVKSGDTLNKIAQANNTTVATLVSVNGITDSNFIVVGQQIKLTASTAPAQTVAVAPTTQYTAPTTATQPEQSTQTQATVTAPVQATTQTATTEQAPAQTNTPTTSGTSDALQALINKESSGNVNATNGQYYGIGQLSPQARATYGGNSTDYNDQLNAMKSYISARYGSAENAWAHSQATGWY